MKLEEVEKLQNDIEVLMKKYVDNEGNIKHWKVQSIAGSIVKNLIIQRVSVAVCAAPDHVLPCRHHFSGICQYNSHCNFKQTER